MMSNVCITTKLSESKTKGSPIDECVIDFKVALELKIESKQEVFSDPVLSYKKSKREMKACISILKSQIRKTKAPERVCRTLLLSLIGGLGVDMLVTYLAYLTGVNNYNNAQASEVIYGHNRIPFNGTCQDRHEPPQFMDGNSYCDNPPFLTTIPCTQLWQDLCKVLWWIGPIPQFMIGFGMILPAFLLGLDAYVVEVDGHSIFNPARYGWNFLQKLNVSAEVFISEVGKRYKIVLEGSLEDKLKIFETALKNLSIKRRQYQQRLAFVSATHKRLGKESSLQVSFFKHPLLQDKIAQEVLCREVFEYAGFDRDFGAKQSRAAVIFGIQQKNRVQPIGKFLNELINEKDIHEKNLYDKEETLNAIFQFADIAKPRLR